MTSNYLDCNDQWTIYSSLSSIIGVDEIELVRFIHERVDRVYDTDSGWHVYEKITTQEFLDYFNLDNIIIEEVSLFHVSTIMHNSSIHKMGLLNFKDIALTNNDVTKFLMDNFSIKIELENNYLVAYSKGEKIDAGRDSMFRRRLKEDYCVNGYLFREGIERESDIEHIKDCPEILTSIGSALRVGDSLKELWKKVTKPVIISLKVSTKDIDYFSKGIAEQNVTENLIEIVMKKLVYSHALNFQYDNVDDNAMVFLKNSINIPADKILAVEGIERD